MKNWLILITLCILPFFNSIEAGKAKITLVSTTTNGDIIEDPKSFKTKIHLDSFRAFSRDDCEEEMTLKGTVEIVDILEPWQQFSGQSKNGGRFRNRIFGNSSKNSQKTFGNKGSKGFYKTPYRKFSIDPTIGNMTTFNSTLEDNAKMWEFGNTFYLVFKLQDVDNCGRGESDMIDINPEIGNYESLKLHVDINKKEIRLVKGDDALGEVVGVLNQYFTVQGKDALPNVELGGLKLKVSRTKSMGGINTIKGNGG